MGHRDDESRLERASAVVDDLRVLQSKARLRACEDHSPQTALGSLRAPDMASATVETEIDRRAAEALVPCTLTELLYFLRLGTAGFGGPIALVGYMQRDLVEERRWISRQD